MPAFIGTITEPGCLSEKQLDYIKKTLMQKIDAVKDELTNDPRRAYIRMIASNLHIIATLTKTPEQTVWLVSTAFTNLTVVIAQLLDIDPEELHRLGHEFDDLLADLVKTAKILFPNEEIQP